MSEETTRGIKRRARSSSDSDVAVRKEKDPVRERGTSKKTQASNVYSGSERSKKSILKKPASRKANQVRPEYHVEEMAWAHPIFGTSTNQESVSRDTTNNTEVMSVTEGIGFGTEVHEFSAFVASEKRRSDRVGFADAEEDDANEGTLLAKISQPSSKDHRRRPKLSPEFEETPGTQEEQLNVGSKKKLRKNKGEQGQTLEPKPKQIPHTLETLREKDATTVAGDDEEVLEDEQSDEIAPYFNRATAPRLLVTTSDKARKRTIALAREIANVIPSAEYKSRRRFALKKIISECVNHGITDVIIINENRDVPDALTLCHLPNGPTAVFKLRSVKLTKEIKNVGEMTDHHPEVILTNFSTRLGHTVGRMFAALFPHDPNFHGRRAMTFHNQRDFIFFRNHRYIFRNSERVGLQELGPKFTMKLRSLQRGTFDSIQGEYLWIHKQLEMNKSRRKFFL